MEKEISVPNLLPVVVIGMLQFFVKNLMLIQQKSKTRLDR